MGKELENVKKVLKEYGQEHLLLKYDEMDEHDQRALLDQIEDIDFDLMKQLYDQATKPVDLETITIEQKGYNTIVKTVYFYSMGNIENFLKVKNSYHKK